MQQSNPWILVSVWGDPGGWDYVMYRTPELPAIRGCKLTDVGWNDRNIRQNSTLGAILESYSDIIASAIVYVADTLALSPYVFDYEEAARICSGDNLCKDYKNIIECSKKYVLSFLRSNNVLEQYMDRINVHVLPGIGEYKRKKGDKGDGLKAAYIGHPSNYYFGLLTHLYSYLVNNDKTIDTVLLDISHGINFMPVLGFRAVVEAIKLYMIERGREKTRLIVLNSDPVIGKESTKTPKNINIVYCKEFSLNEVLNETYYLLRAANFSQRPFKQLVSKRPQGSPERLNNAHNKLKKHAELVKVIAISLDAGLMLPLVYTLEELKQKSKDFNELYDDLINGLEDIIYNRLIERGDGQVDLVVKHETRLDDINEQYLRAVVLSKTLMNYVEKIIRKTKKTCNGKTVTLYNIHDLEHAIDDYIVNNIAEKIAENEISNIRDRVNAYKIICNKDNEPIELTLYKTIYDLTEKEVGDTKIINHYRRLKKESSDYEDIANMLRKIIEKEKTNIRCRQSQEPTLPKNTGIDNERNFFAHAGFYGSVTLVTEKDGNIYTGYVPGVDYRRVILSS